MNRSVSCPKRVDMPISKTPLKTGLSLLLCLSLFLSLACNRGEETKRMVSSDGRFEITVPGAWTQETKLHDEAQIQATHRSSNQFTLVIAEEKGDFDNISLEEFCAITLDGMHQKLKSPREGKPTTLIIDRNTALQRELRATMDYLKIIYLHTCIESPTHFYQIIQWTTPSKYAKHRKTFKKITQYFKERKRDQPPSPNPLKEVEEATNQI